MQLVKIEDIGSSKLDGTIKFSILNNTEGQFIAYMKKDSNSLLPQVEYLKPIKNKSIYKNTKLFFIVFISRHFRTH